MSSEAVKTTRKVPDKKANLSKEISPFKLSYCKLHCLSPALMDMLIPSSRPKNSAKYVAKGSAYSESCMSPFLDLSFEKHGHEETHMS